MILAMLIISSLFDGFEEAGDVDGFADVNDLYDWFDDFDDVVVLLLPLLVGVFFDSDTSLHRGKEQRPGVDAIQNSAGRGMRACTRAHASARVRVRAWARVQVCACARALVRACVRACACQCACAPCAPCTCM
jgi:hypothetical protein